MNDIETKITVIVPVYNSEKYIKNCIQSVLKQTFTELELILIDDGSDDGSNDICKKYCVRDERIKLIQQVHKGVSAARNMGIDVAEGKYLFFLDSDDIIHPQLLEVLYKLQNENHTAIATVGLYRAEEGRFQPPPGWKIEVLDTQESFCLNNADAIKPYFFTHSKTMLYAIGGKLILRNIVGEMRFDETLSHGEDTWFVYQILTKGANVTVLLRNWYYYRKGKQNDDEVYLLEMYKSKYKARVYIRDYQIKNERISDALAVEWDILSTLIEWNEIGRRRKKIRLKKYVDKLINYERKTWLFSKLNWSKKIVFYFGCEHYYIYKLLPMFLTKFD